MSAGSRIASYLLFLSIALAAFAPAHAVAQERGTIGLVLRQIYDDSKPDHRGPLAVMHVIEGSPADKAGIHCSDFILAVNGVAVPGRDFSDIFAKDLRGSVGSKVALSISRYDGSTAEITLIRAPYPTHVSQSSDPFSFSIPGTWAADPRYTFPLPWAPKLAFQGSEDVFFSPNFDDTESPEYHSILFFLWLDGTHVLNTEQLQDAILTYFRGLAEERGQNYGFTPDLSKVAANFKEDSDPATLGGTPAKAFSGRVTIWDTHGKTVSLNSEVRISTCGTPDHTVLFYGMSMQPRDTGIWKQIDTARDAFRCKR